MCKNANSRIRNKHHAQRPWDTPLLPKACMLKSIGMKENIHPQYNTNTQVVCACGNSFTTGSTKDEIRVEICAKCHPFYTGKLRLVDTAGIVDKFKRRQAKSEEAASQKKEKKPRKTQAEKASAQ